MSKLLNDLSRVLLKQFLVLLLIIGVFALGYFFRKDIQISYHKWGEASALKSMRKYNMQDQEKYQRIQDKFDKHRNALIKLGYLEKRLFETEILSVGTPEFEKVLAEFRERHTNCSYSIGDRGEHKISITCRKDFMPTWEELIKKYDVPSDNPNEDG